VADCCEYGDEPSGSGTMELVGITSFAMFLLPRESEKRVMKELKTHSSLAKTNKRVECTEPADL
jgi:hypothetical protein